MLCFMFEGLFPGGTTTPQANPLGVLLFYSVGGHLREWVYGRLVGLVATKTTQ